MKGIFDAKVLRNLICFMVCMEPNLDNMTKLVGVTMSDPGKEHLKMVKWVKGTLSRGLLHKQITND